MRFSAPGMDSDELFDASVGCYTSALLCDSLAMPLLPDLWDSALGCILDLVTLGCQLSVYIWLLLVAFGGHVLLASGLAQNLYHTQLSMQFLQF